MDALGGADPFIMIADGKASLFVPSGLKDGPLPTHYEPVEVAGRATRSTQQQDNPAAKSWERADNRYHAVGDPRYPVRAHHLPPDRAPLRRHRRPARCPHWPSCSRGFAEIPPELARGARHRQPRLGGAVAPRAARSRRRALVTERLRPFEIDGRRVHQIGMPWHFGWEGYATGDIANVLTGVVGDPNTSIHESKALTCNLRKGRLTRGQLEASG